MTSPTRLCIVNNETYGVPSAFTPEEILAVVQALNPELTDAVATVDANGTVTIERRADAAEA